MKTFSIFLAATLTMSCQKELSQTDEPHDEAQAFKQLLTADKTFRVVEFYADIPIDYNPNDSITVKETDLWSHVIYYLKDDENVFRADGSLEVEQHEIKIPGDTAAVLFRRYSMETVDGHVLFDFLDHNYNAFRYYLHEKGTNYFILYTKQGNARLFSKFVQVE